MDRRKPMSMLWCPLDNYSVHGSLYIYLRFGAHLYRVRRRGPQLPDSHHSVRPPARAPNTRARRPKQRSGIVYLTKSRPRRASSVCRVARRKSKSKSTSLTPFQASPEWRIEIPGQRVRLRLYDDFIVREEREAE